MVKVSGRRQRHLFLRRKTKSDNKFAFLWEYRVWFLFLVAVGVLVASCALLFQVSRLPTQPSPYNEDQTLRKIKDINAVPDVPPAKQQTDHQTVNPDNNNNNNLQYRYTKQPTFSPGREPKPDSKRHDEPETQQSNQLLRLQLQASPNPQQQRQQQHQSTAKDTPYQYKYGGDQLKKIDQPWQDWSKCDPQAAFQKVCHPKPATCTSIKDDILNNHGIGNALLVTYLKVASDLLKEQPDCAPIMKDKPMRPTTTPGTFLFRLLDYVQEPTVVVEPSEHWRDQNAKCLAFAITQPREAVAKKVHEIQQKWHTPQQSKNDHPLVAIHLRTGWSDELQRNEPGWKALGSCNDYRDQFSMDMVPHAVSDVALKDMLLDAAAAADRVFPNQQWRLYVASDAPGIRSYVRYLLQDRVTGPVVWLEGSRIGHNYQGGMATSYEEKVETSVSAFTDLIMMSLADLLICLSSKYPGAANMRSGGCPQRFAELRGHPRHDLATTGKLLSDAFHQDRPNANADNNLPWSPALSKEARTNFFKVIPGGMDNPCTQAADPIRACFCLIKLSHE